MTDYGLCFHRTEPAATVVARAQAAESQGFDEFWVIEDCFFTAGVSLAAAALTATSTITVGIGIMPVVARNAAMTAMEIATLAELAPGRFHAGLGHGVQDWMRQMHAAVDSPLTVLDETFVAVQQLLRGDEVSTLGRYVSLDQVQLDQAPVVKPLVSAGVRGPKSLAIAGRVADGVVLADFVGPDYIRWVRDQVNAAGADPNHRITVFASLASGPAGAMSDIRAGMHAHLAEVAESPPLSLRMAPFFEELEAVAKKSSWAEAVGSMPDEWLAQIAAFGTPEQVAAYVSSIVEAGADAVTFFPSPHEPLRDAAFAAEQVLPLLP